MADSSPTSISLKLLMDSNSKRLVFSEAGKDFVDFIFSIMSLHVGTVVKLLGKHAAPGCTRNIYASIEAFSYAANESLLLPSIRPSSYTNLYGCGVGSKGKCRRYVANNPTTRCPNCSNLMNRNFHFVKLNKVGEGFVKEGVSYMITDDLMDNITFGFVKIGCEVAEGIVAVQNFLTDVFLGKKSGKSDVGKSGIERTSG
ncbi:hypothetical protein F3Y22_tig00110020pilonHSYRG00412 [Hibiscus syriacus]|uniref:Uncharacterized protein n=1 Tax=Hibiscus syriacus TaxID=106335 RepID=A0A6A3BN14_HIBSY|nr:hypothetical protein F3Y22_tig00110020pilonHSYRG00412 [Hibiscus syriacus]